MQEKKWHYNLAGLSGFFGLFGFRYFFTGQPGDLFFFAAFAGFSFFILRDINREIPDERWFRNSYAAGKAALFVAIGFIFLVGFVSATSLGSREFAIVASAIGWDVSILTYAIAFRSYERA